MKWLAIISLQFALIYNRPLCAIPSELSNAKYDGFIDDAILPEEDMMVNRKRDEPESEDRVRNDEDDISDNNDFTSYVSNSNNGVNSYSYSSSSSNGQSIVNGVDTSKLPPNYHNVTTKTKIINGRPVTVHVTIDKKTDPVTGQVTVSVSENSGSSSSSTSTSAFGKPNVCRSTKHCKSGYFCKSSWIMTCQKCHNILERCGQNEECCGTGTAGALCVNGMCQVGYRQGDAGTLCQRSADCHPSMCCSRSFMQRFGICKPLARYGEKCATSSSTMNRMVDPRVCPCAQGLICSSGSWTERFFGGSMNTFLGGNTCRVPRRMPTRSGWWRRRQRNRRHFYDNF